MNRFILTIIIFMLSSVWGAKTQVPASNVSVGSIAWSPDNLLLAVQTTVEGQSAIQIYDQDDQVTQSWTALGSFIQWSPDGTKIATSNSYSYFIWNVTTGEQISSFSHTLPQESYNELRVFWLTDSQRIVTFGNYFGYVRNSQTGEVLQLFGQTSTPVTLGDSLETAFVSSDSNRAYLARTRRSLEVWNVDSGELMQSYALPVAIVYMDVSHSESKIAFVGGGAVTYILEAISKMPAEVKIET